MKVLGSAAVSISTFLLLFSIHSAHSFEIKVSQDPSAGLRLEFPGATNYYHQIQSAPAVTGLWSAVAILIGTNGTQRWTNSAQQYLSNSESFFRVQRVPITQPADADKDGINDLYELKWPFLNPLDAADARQDQDRDALLNIGEYLLATDPTDPDTDKDWVLDGYEVSKGTNPKNSSSAPPLEFRINNSAIYTSNATVSLDFGPHVADEVALSESPLMVACHWTTQSRAGLRIGRKTRPLVKMSFLTCTRRQTSKR